MNLLKNFVSSIFKLLLSDEGCKVGIDTVILSVRVILIARFFVTVPWRCGAAVG
jgi:hypothetical protein